MNKGKITIVGGDQRNLALAKMLVAKGAHVTLYGFNTLDDLPGVRLADHLSEALRGSNIIIGPLPFTSSDNYLSAPLFTGKITIDDIFKNMTDDQFFFAGKVQAKWMELATKQSLKLYDYFKRESLQVLHAIPTSEAAIQIAMEKMATTIHSTNVLVLGFGRIGKTLAKMLDGLGANVFVASEDDAELTWVNLYRYGPVHLKTLSTILPKVDLIFNTIPAQILDDRSLKQINKEALIIDLASPPGGVDFHTAKEIGIEVIWAQGLPGKVAPISSASYIKETINEMIGELEV